MRPDGLTFTWGASPRSLAVVGCQTLRRAFERVTDGGVDKGRLARVVKRHSKQVCDEEGLLDELKLLYRSCRLNS